MKPSPALLAGIFAAFAFSWFGLTVVPQEQIGNLQPEVDEEAGTVYPMVPSGLAERGRQVYHENGCVYCHTQVVREVNAGADIARGWGKRRTFAKDYIYENPIAIGYVRFGPDLSNIGSEELLDPSTGAARHKDAAWHYQHLFNPRSLVKNSLMPPYSFFFNVRKISGQRSEDALALSGTDAPAPGYEVVPSADAKALVAYLQSLDRGQDLKDAKASPLAKLVNSPEGAVK
jgi:cytochrome c oxidase cbb3-type subunit II